MKLRTRVALVEVGHGELTGPLYRNLRDSGACVVLDPARFAAQSREAALAGPAEKSAFAARLQKEAGANVVVYMMAPEGKGAALTADAYDAMGGGILRTISANVPPSSAPDPAPGESSVSAALSSVADQITELVSYLPWFGRITEADGERTYIAAGKETGLKIGQVLQVYRRGRFVEGLGFAPGDRIGSLAIAGFVGPGGSFGVLHDGQRAQPADLVSAE